MKRPGYSNGKRAGAAAWRQWVSALLGLFFLCGSVKAADAPDFTVVALPDTQFYCESFPQILAKQVDWIIANREKLNIVYVAHLGDITNQGDDKPEQWKPAADALYRLENPTATGLPAGIPYGVVPGNHDHRGGTREYNKVFGPDHFQSKPFYGGHLGSDNNNHFDTFSVGGLDFIVIFIDFDGDRMGYQAIDTWADDILKSHPNRRAIVISHDLLSTKALFDPRGQAIYDNLKAHPNLFLMLCGHNHGESRRVDLHEGRTVISCLSDYQAAAEGGGGFLRLYRFSPSENLVRVQTYSPWLNEYKTDPQNQFEFHYRMDAGPLGGLGLPQPEIPEVTGKTESAKP